MPHVLIAGRSGTGKSRVVREHIIPGWRARGYPVLVLDPVGQPWGADWQTKDPETFLAAAQGNHRCILIVDECEETLRVDPALERRMKYLATRSRNDGHRAYFLCQRAYQCPPSVRGNVEELYAFMQMPEDAEALTRMYGLPRVALELLPALAPGLCLHVPPLCPPRLVRTFADGLWRGVPIADMQARSLALIQARAPEWCSQPATPNAR